MKTGYDCPHDNCFREGDVFTLGIGSTPVFLVASEVMRVSFPLNARDLGILASPGKKKRV